MDLASILSSMKAQAAAKKKAKPSRPASSSSASSAAAMQRLAEEKEKQRKDALAAWRRQCHARVAQFAALDEETATELVFPVLDDRSRVFGIHEAAEEFGFISRSLREEDDWSVLPTTRFVPELADDKELLSHGAKELGCVVVFKPGHEPALNFDLQKNPFVREALAEVLNQHSHARGTKRKEAPSPTPSPSSSSTTETAAAAAANPANPANPSPSPTTTTTTTTTPPRKKHHPES